MGATDTPKSALVLGRCKAQQEAVRGPSEVQDRWHLPDGDPSPKQQAFSQQQAWGRALVGVPAPARKA